MCQQSELKSQNQTSLNSLVAPKELIGDLQLLPLQECKLLIIYYGKYKCKAHVYVVFCQPKENPKDAKISTWSELSLTPH